MTATSNHIDAATRLIFDQVFNRDDLSRVAVARLVVMWATEFRSHAKLVADSLKRETAEELRLGIDNATYHTASYLSPAAIEEFADQLFRESGQNKELTNEPTEFLDAFRAGHARRGDCGGEGGD